MFRNKEARNVPVVDKVNMSLDDIIKMNKKQTRGAPYARGGRGGGGGNSRGAGAFRPNRQAPRQQQQQSPRKEYGMLNRSKVIKKRGRGRGPRPAISASKVQFSTGKGGAKVSTFRRRRPLNKIAANRALNRFGSTRPKFQNRSLQNQAPRRNGIQANNNQNRIKIIRPVSAEAAAAKVAIATNPKNGRKRFNIKQVQPRAAARARLAATNGKSKAKIAMQKVRKNIQKAKLKAPRKGPIQQLMTQRYANNLLAKKRQQTSKAVKKAHLLSGLAKERKMLRVNIKQKPKAQLPQAKSTKPIIRRNRMSQPPNSNRMVFY